MYRMLTAVHPAEPVSRGDVGKVARVKVTVCYQAVQGALAVREKERKLVNCHGINERRDIQLTLLPFQHHRKSRWWESR